MEDPGPTGRVGLTRPAFRLRTLHRSGPDVKRVFSFLSPHPCNFVDSGTLFLFNKRQHGNVPQGPEVLLLAHAI